MRSRWAHWGVILAAVTAASAAAALTLGSPGDVAPKAFGLKVYQTTVNGVIGTFPAYSQTVNAPVNSPDVKVAEGEAAATIQSYGQCPSRPRVVSQKKGNALVQITGKPCSSSGGLSCNSSGANGGGETEGTSNGGGGGGCATSTTFGGEGGPG